MDKLIFFLFLVMFVGMISGVSAETQTASSSGKTLDVKLDFDDPQPNQETRMKIDFLNPMTGKIQEHIDYTVNITNSGNLIFGPIPLTHTSTGSVSIPVTLEKGNNTVLIEIEGILFMPIPLETIEFDVAVGEPQNTGKVPTWVKNNAEWWAGDLIDDTTFISGIQFLVQEEIIEVSSEPSEAKGGDIPKWIKNNAEWWSQGLISENDFLKGIEYLVQNGIISMSSPNSENDVGSVGGVDLSQASPVLGLHDAPVTIIEFGDYQCPNCKKWFLNTKPDIMTNFIDTGKANLYFVDLAFLGDDSLPAAAATYCANEQGQYWEYHSHLYSNQRGIDSGWANMSSLKTYADVLELDQKAFTECLESGRYDKSIVFNLEESINNEVKATPSFIVVGPDGQRELITGPQPYVVFESVIKSMLE